MKRELHSLYSNPCSCCINDTSLHLVMISDDRWDKILEKVFKGDLNTGDIPEDLLTYYGSFYTGAIDKGRGSGIADLQGEMQYWQNDILMKRNAFDFAAAKSYNLVDELASIRDAGGFKTLDEFKQFIGDRRLGNLYNNTWLQSEAQHFLASSQMSTKWIDYDLNKDVAPNLRYDTAGDDRVRDSHAALDGYVAPKDDRFWDTHYPPNDWGCRCDATETEAKPRKKKVPSDVVGDMFKNNPGKTGLAVTNKHPYFKRIDKNNHNVYSAVSKVMEELKSLNVYKNGKGSISIHPLQLSSELEGNLSTAKVLADNDLKVNLPKYLEDGKVKPDALVNKKSVEFKLPEKSGSNSIVNAIKTANTQEASIVVINFQDMDVKVSELAKGLRNAIGAEGQNNKGIKEVWLIYNGELKQLTRKEILSDKLWELL